MKNRYIFLTLVSLIMCLTACDKTGNGIPPVNTIAPPPIPPSPNSSGLYTGMEFIALPNTAGTIHITFNPGTDVTKLIVTTRISLPSNPLQFVPLGPVLTSDGGTTQTINVPPSPQMRAVLLEGGYFYSSINPPIYLACNYATQTSSTTKLFPYSGSPSSIVITTDDLNDTSIVSTGPPLVNSFMLPRNISAPPVTK